MPPDRQSDRLADIERDEREDAYQRGRLSGIRDEREAAIKAGVFRHGRYVTPDEQLRGAVSLLNRAADLLDAGWQFDDEKTALIREIEAFTTTSGGR